MDHVYSVYTREFFKTPRPAFYVHDIVVTKKHIHPGVTYRRLQDYMDPINDWYLENKINVRKTLAILSQKRRLTTTATITINDTDTPWTNDGNNLVIIVEKGLI